MGIINKNRIKGCIRDGEGYQCKIEMNGRETTINGRPSEIANFVAKDHITKISGNVPKSLKKHLDLATDPQIQNELDKYEKLAIRRQMMDERAKDYPEEKNFLDRIKNEVTSPSDVRRVKQIGNERIAKSLSEEKKKEFS